MHRLLVACAIFGLLVIWPIDAQAEATLSVEIGPQPLAQALEAFAKQTGLQIIYVSDLAAARRSNGAQAGLSPLDALTQLLDGTGLAFQWLNARTVKIFAPASLPAVAPVPRTKLRKERAAASTKPTQQVVVTGSRSHGDHLIPVEDVRLLPASVTVLEGDRLATQKLDQLSDYAAYLPGLNMDTAGVPSDQILILRGIASLTDASSVGYYIDDTPVGASGGRGNGCCIALDLMPYDLERLEVHLGPQGTRFGAGSESGILRYVLKEPSFSRFEARVGADVSAIQGASKAGTTLQAVVNAPIVDDVLAIRLNAYDSATPGYIDNAYSGAKDVNDLRRNGGRVATLWRPNESLSLKATAFWNRLSANSLPEISSSGVQIVPNTGDAYIVKASHAFGDLTQNRAFLHPWKQNIDYYSANVRWNAGSIEIGSATAWSSMATGFSLDFSPLNGAPSGSGDPADLMRFDRNIGLEKFTEELRITSAQGRRVEWALGGFYDHERVTDRSLLNGFDASYHPIAGFAQPETVLSTFEARALYADTTWGVSDHLDVTGGIRYEHSEQAFSAFTSDVPVASGQESDSEATWTAAARYHITPDAMLYGRIATGFQPGVERDISFTRPERLTSYEAGSKSEFPNHNGVIDVSVFYIDWTDIQVGVAGGPTNGGRARSRGGELSTSYSPLPGMKLGFIAAFTECEITEVIPAAAYLLTGYQVPQVPKWRMASSAEYNWLLRNTWHAYVGGSLQWVGRQWGLLVQSRSLGGAPTIEKAAYAVVDLNAGMAKDRVAIKLVARNFLDRRAALHSNLVGNDDGVPTQAEAYILQPRTIGVGFEFSL